ncbi:MAG: methionine--tRNA ligase [Bacillota bacterium]|nr:methionine--tRNA ligase [Bacillota bacterium]
MSRGEAAAREGSRPSFYLTVAIDYSNSAPHLGHAYEKVAGDALVRYHRLRGEDGFFLGGNDEHSVNVLKSARAQGLEPKEYCDRMHRVFQETYERLGLQLDEFMQTSGERHVRAVQELARAIYENGYVYKGRYAGWYCPSCEAFYTEKDLDAEHLCPVHGRPAEYIEEENYFFRLSAFRDRILRHIESHPDFVQPETRRNEVLAVLRGGLEDISISRAHMEWGIPIPWDPSQVVYVWFDALASYISGIGYGSDPERFRRYWPADVHLVGKDISRFHAIIWPAMLMAAGLELPRKVFVHGFLNYRGSKLSKSSGNVIAPADLLDKYGVDPVRWFLCAETPFGEDGDFTEETFIHRVNADLANDLGNLLSRVTAMIDRYAAGRIPSPEASDGVLRKAAAAAKEAYTQAMERLALREAAQAALEPVRRANKYLDEQAPWELARHPEQRARLEAVLYDVAEVLRVSAVLVSPFLVQAPERIWEQLGAEGSPRSGWSAAEWGGLRAGTPIRRGSALFPRLEPPSAGAGAAAPSPQPQRGTLAAAARDEAPAAAGLVDVETFRQLDLRVARIEEAERIPGADRLLRLVLSAGELGRRQVVAGVAEHYRPEELVGRQVVFVANLKPARLRGVESQGMILAASGEGELALVAPEHPVEPGTRVK